MANPAGLAGDVYRGSVRISSDAGTVDVPVQFALTEAGPALGLSQTGLRFDARQSQGAGNTQTVNILNVGDGTGNWSAGLLQGQDWLSLTPASGQVIGANPSALAVTVNPGALAAGPYYAMIRISDPQALNSPQYLRVVLNLSSAVAAVAPELTPAGMVFDSVAGSAAPLAQALRIYASSAAPVAFQVSAVTSDGTGWLAATPASGMVSTGQTAQVNVTANKPI
jgi:hypothetical protein